MSDPTHDRINAPSSPGSASGDPSARDPGPAVVPQLDAASPRPRPTGWSPTSWRNGGDR